MKKIFLFIMILITFCVGYFLISLHYEEPENPGEFPPCLHNGKKWTIGYLQGGNRSEYNSCLKNFINHLAKRGWLEPVNWNLIPTDANAREIWNFLAHNMDSKYLRIQKVNFWDPEWDFAKRVVVRRQALEILKVGKVDLMLAMGMWAGQDIANNLHSVPTIYLGSPFPIQKYFKNEKNIPDHVYLPSDPDFLLRQILLFRKITKFKRLGVVYEASSGGRFLASLKILERLSKKRNFKLIAIRILPTKTMNSKEKFLKEIEAYNKIAPQIDAMWLSSFFMNDPEAAKQILAPFFKYNIPTWYPHGRQGVTNGAIFGIIHNPQRRADHYATVASKIFNGVKPSSLIEDLPIDNQLVINYAAADKIGLKIPRTLLAAADRSYLNINAGKK